MKRLMAFCLFTFGASLWLATSHAVVVSIDSFSVSGTNLAGFSFTDNFSDGTPPPCGPSGCSSQPFFYGVNSTNPLPAESGGFLQLDSSNGIAGTNAGGGARINESVYVSELLSDTGGAISMAGIFSLPVLSGPLNEGYGIVFGGVLQSLDLNVQWWIGNASNPAGWYVRYLVQDHNLSTITTIGAALVTIPSGADEIYLSLSRAAGSDLFAADYAYVAGGSVGSLTSLGSAQGFQYGPFIRPQFHAFETVPAPGTTVPEPGTLLLMAGGIIALVAARRRLPLNPRTEA